MCFFASLLQGRWTWKETAILIKCWWADARRRACPASGRLGTGETVVWAALGLGRGLGLSECGGSLCLDAIQELAVKHRKAGLRRWSAVEFRSRRLVRMGCRFIISLFVACVNLNQ